MALKKGDRVELVDDYYGMLEGTPGTILCVAAYGYVTFQADGSPRRWTGMSQDHFRLAETPEDTSSNQDDYKAELERAQAKAEAYRIALYATQRKHRAYVHQVSENEAMLAAQERSKQASLANASAQQDLDKAMQALEQWS